MHAAAGEGGFQRRAERFGAGDARALRAIGPAYFTKSGLPKVMPKSGKASTACFQRIMP
jgi:hypothetical protein